MQQNLAEIIARVRELTEGHPVLLVLLDYWSVWLGGQYAEAQGPAYVDAYVDLRAAFKGPDYAFDETHHLSNGGDHPNAAGHEQIAAAVVEVVTQTLRT
jgi:acyl-CoA thioesterase I